LWFGIGQRFLYDRRQRIGGSGQRPRDKPEGENVSATLADHIDADDRLDCGRTNLPLGVVDADQGKLQGSPAATRRLHLDNPIRALLATANCSYNGTGADYHRAKE